MTSCLLPSTEEPFQNDGISDEWMGIWRKFGENLNVGIFLSVQFGYFETVLDIPVTN